MTPQLIAAVAGLLTALIREGLDVAKLIQEIRESDHISDERWREIALDIVNELKTGKARWDDAPGPAPE